MGCRLRNLKKENGRIVGGAGRLTVNYINKLSTYYSKAIRENSHSVQSMYKAIWATFYHESSTDTEPKHEFRPAMAEGKLNGFKHKPALEEEPWNLIRPIYESLTDVKLLERCLGGYTQNRNECLNSKIWKFAPKKTYSGIESVKIATAIAIMTFNDGIAALVNLSREIGLDVGAHMHHYIEETDRRRDEKRRRSCEKRGSKSPEQDDNNSDWDGEIFYALGMAG